MIARLRSWLHRARGHAWILIIEPRRIYLRCTICPTESTGWRL
jgi:hypothetical protein